MMMMTRQETIRNKISVPLIDLSDQTNLEKTFYILAHDMIFHNMPYQIGKTCLSGHLQRSSFAVTSASYILPIIAWTCYSIHNISIVKLNNNCSYSLVKIYDSI